MPDEVQEIKNRIDIVDLVQEYTRLKQAGRHWKACCPFHKEKTPSFIVSRDKQFFHCFGCGKSGDVFNFIQEIEGLDFRETLKLLADKAGVRLEEHHDEVHKDQKNRILDF
jgi:DNA primase